MCIGTTSHYHPTKKRLGKKIMGGKMARVLITLLLAFYQLLKVLCNILLNVLKVLQSHSFRMGRLKLAKGGLISESFSFWLKSQKRVPNYNPEHLFFKQIVLRTVI